MINLHVFLAKIHLSAILIMSLSYLCIFAHTQKYQNSNNRVGSAKEIRQELGTNGAHQTISSCLLLHDSSYCCPLQGLDCLAAVNGAFDRQAGI